MEIYQLTRKAGLNQANILTVWFNLNRSSTIFLPFILNFLEHDKVTGENLRYASVISVQNAFYVIGGKTDSISSNIIGRMDPNRQWSQAGELVKARHGHNVIYDGTYLMVVGGRDSAYTEKCTIESGTVICSTQTPKLTSFSYYPELFLVSDSFCKD